MGEYSNANSSSLEWGRKKEETALNLYMKVNKKTHQKACMQRYGLLLYEIMSYIVYSVDGIFTCKCHTSRVIEVKCPYSARFDNLKDVAADKLHMDEHYHEIQGQMGIDGLDKCDLVIYTSKGICVTTVDFDPFFLYKCRGFSPHKWLYNQSTHDEQVAVCLRKEILQGFDFVSVVDLDEYIVHGNFSIFTEMIKYNQTVYESHGKIFQENNLE
ncbi:unnamed protein product [Mytilus coruscus]|uniref:YqaJ viral recombinase domain-containing protein n=1 Tax=Mytilus coruscus TaxID=42192 RepID=A0A6J8EIC6_MYTCO|nr:unnamed protein product [Mytilus coruscus]